MSEDDAPRPVRRCIRKVMVVSSSDSDSDSSVLSIPLGTRRKRLRVLSDGSESSGSPVVAPRRKRTLRALRPSEDSDSSGWSTDHSNSTPLKPGPSAGKTGSGFSSDSSEGNSEKCSICLQKFKDQEVGIPETCEHIFCIDCITEWSKNVNTCPVDRIVFNSITVKSHAAGRVLRIEKVKVQERRPSMEILVIEDPTACEVCGQTDDEERMLLCDGCDLGYHLHCLTPPLSEIPMEQWLCPNCDELLDVIHISELDDLFTDIADLDLPMMARPTALRQPRTARRSSRNTRALDEPSTSSGNRGPGPSTSTSTSRQSGLGRSGGTRRRRQTTRTPRRRKRRARTVIVEYELEENGKFPVTRKVKRRVKKKSRKRPSTAARRSHVRASVRAKLASMAMDRKVERNQVTSANPGVFELSVNRQRAGIPSLSLFGNSHQLDYFSEEEDFGETSMGSTAVAVRPTSSILSTYRQARRKMISIPSPPHGSTAPDLLSSIMEDQTKLHSKNSIVSVTVDGRVNIKLETRERPKKEDRSKADVTGKTDGKVGESGRVDVKKGEAATRKAPAYGAGRGGGWGGGYRGTYHREHPTGNLSRVLDAAGPSHMQAAARAPDHHNPDPFQRRPPHYADDHFDHDPFERRRPDQRPFRDQPPDQRNFRGPGPDQRNFRDQDMRSFPGVPPDRRLFHAQDVDQRFRDRGPDHRPFPEQRQFPAPAPEPRPFRDQSFDQRPFRDQGPEQRPFPPTRYSGGPSWPPYQQHQQDSAPPARHSFGGFENPIDMRTHAPAQGRQEVPFQPLPEPPAFQFEPTTERARSDDGSDPDLVIDTDKYDPTEPTNDDDEEDTSAPVIPAEPEPVFYEDTEETKESPTVETEQAEIPEAVSTSEPWAPEPPVLGAVTFSSDSTRAMDVDVAVRQVLAEHRAMLAARQASDEDDSEGECPNFSIYSATSVHIADLPPLPAPLPAAAPPAPQYLPSPPRLPSASPPPRLPSASPPPRLPSASPPPRLPSASPPPRLPSASPPPRLPSASPPPRLPSASPPPRLPSASPPPRLPSASLPSRLPSSSPPPRVPSASPPPRLPSASPPPRLPSASPPPRLPSASPPQPPDDNDRELKEKVSKRCPITTNPRNPIKIKLNTPTLIKRKISLYDDDDVLEENEATGTTDEPRLQNTPVAAQIEAEIVPEKTVKSPKNSPKRDAPEPEIEKAKTDENDTETPESPVESIVAKISLYDDEDKDVADAETDGTPTRDEAASPGEVNGEVDTKKYDSERDDEDDHEDRRTTADSLKSETEKTDEEKDDDDEVSDKELHKKIQNGPTDENIEKMTESISETEDERSYTPCLDENKSKDTSLETEKDKALEGLDTEMISEEEGNELFSDTERTKSPAPENEVESEVKATSAESKKKKKKESKPKDKSKSKKKSDVAFKKLSKSGKERNYRERDKEEKKGKKEKRESPGAEERRQKRREKRKDLERYDVRTVLTERRRRKDAFGRDITPPLAPQASLSPGRRPDLSPRRRSMSPRRRSMSPQRRPISPRRRSMSPQRRPISPRRRSISLRRRSISLRRKSISPRRRSISPRRAISPRRRSISPRRRSITPRRRSISPRRMTPTATPRKKSISPRRRSRKRSKSPRRKSMTPRRRSHSLRKKSISPRRKSISPRRKSISPRRKSISPRGRKSVSPRGRKSSPARRRRSTSRGRKRARRSTSKSPKPKAKKKKRAAARSPDRHKSPSRKTPKKKRAKRPSPSPAAAGWSPRSVDSGLLSPRTPPPASPPRRARMRRAPHPPHPSKEVFTSGDNILVSVSFKDEERDRLAAERRRRREAKRDRRRRRRAAAANEPAVKPVAIIDLERSPFRELTPSPKNVIVLSDSDHAGEEAPPPAAAPEPEPPQFAVGPKTPPEPSAPPVKFTLAVKPAAARAPNALRDQEEAPATAPAGPGTPPGSPDAYDPFEPTRSPSASPTQADGENAPRSMTLEAAQKTNMSADDVIDRRPISPMEKVMALLQSTRDVSPEPPPQPTGGPPPAPEPQPAPAPPQTSTTSTMPAPAVNTAPPVRIVLPSPTRSQQPKLFLAKPSPIKSNPVKPMQATKISRLPLPAPRRAPSLDLSPGADSPYSPGSSDFGDLFSPPGAPPPPPSKTSHSKRDVFDALFDAPPKAKKKKSSAAKVPVKFNKKKGKTQMVGVKMDEDSLKILDDLPSSAVEMQVKSKFLKKLNRQERVVEEVKLVLKPHYNKKHVTKEQYKEILRRAVPKICHNKSGEINPTKIQALVEAYVKKYRKKAKLGLA